MSVKPEEQHDMEFRGSTEMLPAKEESPLRKALDDQFRELFEEQGITRTEREKALDKMEADIRAKGTEHLYVRSDEESKKGEQKESTKEFPGIVEWVHENQGWLPADWSLRRREYIKAKTKHLESGKD